MLDLLNSWMEPKSAKRRAVGVAVTGREGGKKGGREYEKVPEA
jgi:hypothetical protein